MHEAHSWTMHQAHPFRRTFRGNPFIREEGGLMPGRPGHGSGQMDAREVDRLDSLGRCIPRRPTAGSRSTGIRSCPVAARAMALQVHARITKVGRDLWGIFVAANGRWQITPFIGRCTKRSTSSSGGSVPSCAVAGNGAPPGGLGRPAIRETWPSSAGLERSNPSPQVGLILLEPHPPAVNRQGHRRPPDLPCHSGISTPRIDSPRSDNAVSTG